MTTNNPFNVSTSASTAQDPDPTQPTITHATKEDVPTILSMIHELAAYEHATPSVLATESTLLSTLSFAPSPGQAPTPPGYAKTLLLRTPLSEGAQIAGMALYFNNYSTWRAAPGIYLEDLFVRENYRNRGYGKLLIRALAVECKRIGGQRVEWTCLRWNEGSLAFYRSLGAVQMQEWVTLRVDGEVLEGMSRDAVRVANV
ncbi:acyl-CoA N-acyltransferase [Delphinella strobiligena]|nr:acyl-CoA N-acyltransferase [Delphinella strobiligena]